MGLTKINLKWLIIGTSVASRVLMFRAECVCVLLMRERKTLKGNKKIPFLMSTEKHNSSMVFKEHLNNIVCLKVPEWQFEGCLSRGN